jgi:hypothetical protein
MSDPIRSSSSTQLATPNSDPYLDDVGKMSRPDAPNSSSAHSSANSSQAEPPAPSVPAVAKLVSSASRLPSVLPPTAPSAPASTANNNAQRTTERGVAAPYADADVTASGDSVYAGVALLKGSVRKSHGEVEALSVSGQVGAQTEVQVGLQRVAGTSGALSGSVEVFTARANIGIHNDDGSTGFNVGVGATAVGFEGSVGGASGLTYGVAASVGAGVSVGVRDVDRDGSGELCARVSIGPVTVGACVENPL